MILLISTEKAKLSRPTGASHFCLGKSSQNRQRLTLADAAHRSPVLLAGTGTARNSLRSNIRASSAVSSCGARLALKALKVKSGATATARARAKSIARAMLLWLALSNPRAMGGLKASAKAKATALDSRLRGNDGRCLAVAVAVAVASSFN
ncbi:hypothetical protein [Pseudoxanthomonas sp.]|uniref:hypothetical protein n=1 Tax=Pseudoxanthomonas sp. TaxID=1871049 RepID=UPI00262DAE2E|nr:hypothetical protein [Pseudoxanthomonas sp.]WDS38006.1 MAG: hypothetical protein O8I58_09175 [Pseudoxanthomonas sp.]